MSVKINSLELENVKRIKAVALTPTQNGLEVIGGGNGQGKTSVLDGIAWALGGDKYKPSHPERDGSVLPPKLRITMSNGFVVERSGKNSALKVTDPNGRKGGQQILNEFVEQLALDLPKFMEASPREKAETLLKIIGVGGQLRELEQEIKAAYNERVVIGREALRKKKYAEELPYYDGLPAMPISPLELIQQQQDILIKNAENQKMRNEVLSLEAQKENLAEEVKKLAIQLNNATEDLRYLEKKLETSKKDAHDLQDESTAEIEENLRNIDEINIKIRSNLEKEKAEEEAKAIQETYEELSRKIDHVRSEKESLLNGANLPLPGLSVEEGELTYNGQKWDCMSGAEQLKVSAAIVRALNPECGFVLVDKLEQMDLTTMEEFSRWAEEEGLQIIATRVSTGDECSIIIEDGAEKGKQNTAGIPVWNGGKS